MENKKPKNSPARLRANAKYNKNNYERINLAVPKGTKDMYKAAAENMGYSSLNGFIKDAITEKMERGH